MRELPESWTITSLASICETVKQVDPKIFYDDSFRYVDISSIDSRLLRIVDAKDVPISEAPSRARQLILKDDIVFSTVRTNLKRIARVGEDLNNQIASTGFAVIRPKGEVIPAFIFYYVTSDEFINEVTLLQRGASYPAVRSSDVFSRKIPLAPLPEQKRIVAKLDTLFAHLDQLKARLEKIPDLLKQFRQAVLTQAVTGKLTEEWRTISDLQEGQSRNLGELGKVLAGQSPSVSEVNNSGLGVLYVTGPEQWDGNKFIKPKWTTNPKKLAPEKSIFVTVKGAGVGKTFPGVKAAIGRDVYAFVPDELNDYKYVMFAIQASVQDVILKAKGLIPGLTKNDLTDHPIYRPVIEEQKEIVCRVESLFAVADRIEASYRTLQEKIDKLPQAILRKAFRGELVKEANF